MAFLLAGNHDHVVIHGSSIAFAVISQLFSDIILFILGTNNREPNDHLFSSFKNVSETFPLDVTMDWWSEVYWIMIDLWSTAWLLDAAVSFCRRNVLGRESCNPEIHPPVFYLTWTAINMARMCGTPLWHRHYILVGAVLRWILPVLSFFMLYMSYYNLNKHKVWLAINNPSVISKTRFLTQNGIAAFAWWSLLKAVVGLGIVLKYNAGVQDPLISTIVLTVVVFCVFTWFILQSFLFTKYMRDTFSVYVILILGLGAMFTRSYRVHDFAGNTVYCGFLMLLMTIMSVIHLITACLYTDKSSKSPAMDLELKFETVCQPEGKIQHIKLQS